MPHLPLSTLPAIPGGWQLQRVQLPNAVFQLKVPAVPDAVLDEAVEQLDGSDTEITPYWACLWPTAPAMAACVLQGSWPRGARTLEIGCGMGLVGIAGLAAGLQVTFSDHIPQAVQLASHNATLNQFSEHQTLHLDWNHPINEKFEVLLANDILYDNREHTHILDVIRHMLTPTGTCWIGDPCRSQSPQFIERAVAANLRVEIVSPDDMQWSQSLRALSGPAKFQLIKLMQDTASSSSSRTAEPSAT